MSDNLRISVPVNIKIREQFYDIIENCNLLITEETELSKEQIYVTVQLNCCEDAYWLGRAHELIRKKEK